MTTLTITTSTAMSVLQALVMAAARISGLGLGRKIGTRHRWSWNPPKLRWIPRSSHFSSSQYTIQTGSRPDSPVQLWTRHSFRKIMNWSFRHNCNIKRSHHLRTMIAQGRQRRKIEEKNIKQSRKEIWKTKSKCSYMGLLSFCSEHGEHWAWL